MRSGFTAGVRRQAVAMHVDPDGVDAEPLRRHDFHSRLSPIIQVSDAVTPSVCMACK